MHRNEAVFYLTWLILNPPITFAVTLLGGSIEFDNWSQIAKKWVFQTQIPHYKYKIWKFFCLSLSSQLFSVYYICYISFRLSHLVYYTTHNNNNNNNNKNKNGPINVNNIQPSCQHTRKKKLLLVIKGQWQLIPLLTLSMATSNFWTWIDPKQALLFGHTSTLSVSL